ncbi:hypothetical protein DPSP01_000039 [Paraphaeosphaeria sporulosa]|uniref:Uncharacterized protein n=1 Tax=Paraphaeosphaeria sporulosa TaxID=1460663 RepID=A0A177D0S4_9PLEO|nr:uncharacterized protein CC84DRAFT_1171659 [Paraphaeosphaeria sporulosa]OAG13041.1 hypothetical protein CC84DRAFT_1171659 [Paraphaeosphaeria sporulosa]
MGKEFFTGWELWQKMTFVLACGIVVTVFIGLIKLQYDRYRIKKYTAVEKGKQAAPTPEMLEAQREETKDDVPFGIRAIESGIEIDGVWISRSNTPVGSSRSSMTDFKLPRSYNSSQLELPQALPPSNSSSKAPSSFDMAVGAERIPTNESRSTSPGRGRPPVSMNRYSQHVNRTLNALEGGPSSGPSSSRREPISDQPSSSSSRENSGKSSRRTSDESEYPDGRPYEPAYINPKQQSHYMPVDPRTDLDLLQSHRMSHVAETGQLTPRPRFRPGNSGEWASIADTPKLPEEIGTVNGVDYFVPQQKSHSPPAAQAATPQDVSPATESPSANQTKQAVPLLESYAPRPFYLPDVYQPKGPQHQFSYDEMPIQVNTSQNEQRDANGQVLRKVNSGFEILRPGTLPTPEEEQPAPVEKRQSKRLQKKRRTSSSGSRTSHFVEQV